MFEMFQLFSLSEDEYYDAHNVHKNKELYLLKKYPLTYGSYIWISGRV
jgi:hypothetical protein